MTREERDRALLIHTAATVAGGLLAGRLAGRDEVDPDSLSGVSVAAARAIIAEVDRTQGDPK